MEVFDNIISLNGTILIHAVFVWSSFHEEDNNWFLLCILQLLRKIQNSFSFEYNLNLVSVPLFTVDVFLNKPLCLIDRSIYSFIFIPHALQWCSLINFLSGISRSWRELWYHRCIIMSILLMTTRLISSSRSISLLLCDE